MQHMCVAFKEGGSVIFNEFFLVKKWLDLKKKKKKIKLGLSTLPPEGALLPSVCLPVLRIHQK